MHPPDPQKSPPAVEARGLRVVLGGQPVLENVDLHIPAGQIVALIGPNGAGKTTLLRCLLGLQKISAGEIRIFGESNPDRALRRVGYVPQRMDLERSFVLSVREFLSLRLRACRHWFWHSRRHTDAQLRAGLPEIGVEPLFDRTLAQLSGGQMQRVLIAFALMGQPELLLLDEPTAGVDLPGEQCFYDLIAQIQRRHHLTVILVSHELSMVYRHADWVYALNRVVCCAGPPQLVMSAQSLKEAFGTEVSPYHHAH